MTEKTIEVYLTDYQIQKIISAINNKTKINLNLQNKKPNYKLKLKNSQTGGFFPLALAPLVAKAALAGLTSWGVSKALNKVTGSGKKCKCRKKGKGIYQNWENH